MEGNGYIPKWWTRELRIIDPKYRAIWNDRYRYYHIQYFNGPLKRWTNIGTYRYLNDNALEDMRRRKRLGLKLRGDPEVYMRWMREQENESKRKEKEIAEDMITEGYMKIHEVGRKQTFDMGG